MAVQVGACLMVEIVDGAVGHLHDVLHILVPRVGGRIGTVAVEVVTPSVGVVSRDVHPLGEVEHEPVGDHPVVHLSGVLVPSVREHTATSRSDRGVGELDAVGVHRGCSVRVDRHDGRADVLGDVPEDA